MSVDYFNANVYSAAAPGGACCVGLLFGMQPCFSGSLFWSVCAEGLLIVVPNGTKSGWVGGWLRALALCPSGPSCCFWCCDPIMSLLRNDLPMVCWAARRHLIGFGQSSSVSSTSQPTWMSSSSFWWKLYLHKHANWPLTHHLVRLFMASMSHTALRLRRQHVQHWFYDPPVPVFVLPGSVCERVPASGRRVKQRRPALALQTTPGALTSPV